MKTCPICSHKVVRDPEGDYKCVDCGTVWPGPKETKGEGNMNTTSKIAIVLGVMALICAFAWATWLHQYCRKPAFRVETTVKCPVCKEKAFIFTAYSIERLHSDWVSNGNDLVFGIKAKYECQVGHRVCLLYEENRKNLFIIDRRTTTERKNTERLDKLERRIEQPNKQSSYTTGTIHWDQIPTTTMFLYND